MTSEWIELKKRRPEKDQWVLVYGYFGKEELGVQKSKWYSGRYWELVSTGCGCCDDEMEDEDITHWMLLPEAPTLEE